MSRHCVVNLKFLVEELSSGNFSLAITSSTRGLIGKTGSFAELKLPVHSIKVDSYCKVSLKEKMAPWSIILIANSDEGIQESGKLEFCDHCMAIHTEDILVEDDEEWFARNRGFMHFGDFHMRLGFPVDGKTSSRKLN